MIGNLGETRKEIKKTIDFSIKLDPDLAQFSVATPFPGTPIFDQINKKGKVKLRDWDQYSQFDQKGYFDYGDLSAEAVAGLTGQAYRRFYLRLKVVLRLTKRRETWLNLPNVFAGGAHYLLQRDI